MCPSATVYQSVDSIFPDPQLTALTLDDDIFNSFHNNNNDDNAVEWHVVVAAVCRSYVTQPVLRNRVNLSPRIEMKQIGIE